VKSPLPVIWFNNAPVIYRRVPDGAGGQRLEAHEQCRTALLPLTPELVEAIEADEARMARKNAN
jgi:hypothetical protein